MTVQIQTRPISSYVQPPTVNLRRPACFAPTRHFDAPKSVIGMPALMSDAAGNPDRARAVTPARSVGELRPVAASQSFPEGCHAASSASISGAALDRLNFDKTAELRIVPAPFKWWSVIDTRFSS